MIAKFPKIQSAKQGSGFFLALACTLFLPLFLSFEPTHAEKFTVNPVTYWVPVLAEFQLDEGRIIAGNSGPPWTKVKSKFPSIDSDWEVLKPMVKIRHKGEWWRDEEPVISGWRHSTLATTAPGEPVGLEVKRSDTPGGDKISFPVVAFDRGSAVLLHWKLEIWSDYIFEENPELRPGDEEYQKLISQKILVTDFSLTVHEVEGASPATIFTDIRTPASFAPRHTNGTIARARGLESLASYASKKYYLHVGVAAPGQKDYILGELRFHMKLRFPEFEGQRESAYDTSIDAQLRFICGGPKTFRVISDKVSKVD